MVLGPAHGLDPLMIGGPDLIDIVRDVGRADEADGVDQRVFQDRIHGQLVAVDHVEHPGRGPRLHHQFGQTHWHRRIAVGGLQDEGVAHRDGHAEHPHRNHGREVERGDARDDAQRLAHRVNVDAGTRAPGVIALQRMRDAAGELDEFQAALDVALGVGDDLAVLAGQQLGQLRHVGLDQPLELEHHPRAALGIGRGTAFEGVLGRLHGPVHLLDRRQLHPGLNLAGVRVEHVGEAARGPDEGRAVDEMVDVAQAGPRMPELALAIAPAGSCLS